MLLDHYEISGHGTKVTAPPEHDGPAEHDELAENEALQHEGEFGENSSEGSDIENFHSTHANNGYSGTNGGPLCPVGNMSLADNGRLANHFGYYAAVDQGHSNILDNLSAPDDAADDEVHETEPYESDHEETGLEEPDYDDRGDDYYSMKPRCPVCHLQFAHDEALMNHLEHYAEFDEEHWNYRLSRPQ
ncbi:hypothetical protein MFIFM68171_04754 [Madurella fahalii]|uniref:Uncharacterized protein n=1 Tax=Madurella fahalii TaxID=1157608 RepID=A0ABQ0G9W2_9PEZI